MKPCDTCLHDEDGGMCWICSPQIPTHYEPDIRKVKPTEDGSE